MRNFGSKRTMFINKQKERKMSETASTATETDEVTKEPVFQARLLDKTLITIEGKLFYVAKETIVEAPMHTFNLLKTTKFEIIKE